MRNGGRKKGSHCRHSSGQNVDIHHRATKESSKEWAATAHLSLDHSRKAFVYYSSIKQRY